MADAETKTKKEKKEKAPKTPKIAYVEFAATDEQAKAILNDDGRITSPTLVNFDKKLHKAPKKTDFDAEHTYMRYRATNMEVQAEAMLKRAKRMFSEADVVASQPDPEKRSAVRRLTRLRDQMAQLEAELEAEGIEV